MRLTTLAAWCARESELGGVGLEALPEGRAQRYVRGDEAAPVERALQPLRALYLQGVERR